MTLEDFLQEHARGCYITNMKFTLEDYGAKSLEIELHSGRRFTVRVPHKGNSTVEVKFEGKIITE